MKADIFSSALEAMGFRVVDVTDYSDRPFTNEWLEAMPPCPGIYELRCMENYDKPERVTVLRNPPERLRVPGNVMSGLWAELDQQWMPVKTWHDGLTDVWWRRLE